MTPARRKRLISRILILITVLFIAALGRILFLGENSLLAMLLARSNAPKAGTDLTVSLSDTSPLLPEIPSTTKLNFKVLAKWKYVEGLTKIPDHIREYDGKWVEITGYMLPQNQTENVTEFLLVQSLLDCCFGKTPEVNHFVAIHMEPGRAVSFHPSLRVKVIGQLSVGEAREHGYLVSLYRLKTTRVIVD